MYDLMTMRVVASDRRAGAQQAADLHRQRVALRADTRSMLAATLQRLAMRLDARASQGPARNGDRIATSTRAPISAGTGDAAPGRTAEAIPSRTELRSAA